MKNCGNIPFVPKSESGWIGLDCDIGTISEPELTLEYEPNYCSRICNSPARIVDSNPKEQTITCSCGIKKKIENYLTWKSKCAFVPFDPERQVCISGRIYPKQPGLVQLNSDQLCCDKQPICNGNVPDWFERRAPQQAKVCRSVGKMYKHSDY